MELFHAYYNEGFGGTPYSGEEDYRRDLFAYLDMCLSIIVAYRQQDETGRRRLGLSEKVRQGIAMTQEEALRSLDFEKPRWEREAGENLAREQLLQAKAHVMGRLAFTPRQGRGFQLAALREAFGLSGPEYFTLLLAMSGYRDAKYEALFQYLQGEGKTSPTLRLAFSLYELTDDISEEEKGRMIQLKGNLFEYLVLGDPSHKGVPNARMVTLSKRAYTFLMEKRDLAPELEGLARVYGREEELPPPYIREEELHKVSRFIGSNAARSGEACSVLHLYGANGNGKKFLVRHGAKACGLNLIVADVSRLISMTIPELNMVIQALGLECRLTGALLCFKEEDFGQEEEDGNHRIFPPMLSYLLDQIADRLDLCVWITLEKAAYLTRYPLHFMALESQMLTVGERITLWREFSRDYPLEDSVDLVLCANQYILTASDIREVLWTADMERISGERERVTREDLLSAIKQRASNQLGSYAALINAVFTWDDLIIDEEQKRQMHMICNQVKYRSVVGEEWGFHRKTPYGRGICAMFYGSPGTGKTMAVQVMANELGLDLYRIDLSQMVSKYIGETEKNISALFRKAKNINALLFFDEADSLFAKRSEVKDSNDRNANAETAHLLQKLEDYSGITILATNYANNIDDAFKRRIKFMVNFVFPGQNVRRRLWTTITPQKVQYEEEIDFEFFAANFELSGSNIKEVLINAAYIAASEQRGLANRDVVEAIRLNFAKYGKLLTQEDFGYLGF